ncbi:MAG: CHAT domain-containing protein [Leptolyngbyaceae cyanobacterium bins.349]|nr:CHAT domain-containing protein [Leptolyngbyaceae cyanobacterium bins.349]
MGKQLGCRQSRFRELFRRRRLLWSGLAIATLLLCWLKTPIWAATPTSSRLDAPLAQIQPERDGKALYDAGRFQEAAIVLEQTVQRLRTQNDPLQLAATLANLSLTYQQLGQFDPATAAIAASLKVLATLNTPTALRVQAQSLEVQGRLLMGRGDGEQALTVWQQAEANYRQSGDETGVTAAQLNQVQALRSQGFSRRALDLLNQMNQRLQTQPDSRQKAMALRSLGDTLQLVGDLRQAEQVLLQGLAVAQRLELAPETSATLLSLGNTTWAQKQSQAAIAYYQQAVSLATTPLARVQAQLNHLNLLIDSNQWVAAQGLLGQIPPTLDALPISRMGIYARINFAQALLRLGNEPDAMLNSQTLSQLLQNTLKSAIQHAQQINDSRAESYALGTLGAVYERTQQVQAAKTVTQRALMLAQSSNTWDVAYRWQWQLGRLFRQTGNVPEAIAAYDAAIANLKSLRGDLAAVNPDVQFNFRDSVEPIYRQSVELLLAADGGNPQPKTLEKARERIEALQLAELDNFFREACLEGKRVLLDQVVDQDNPTTSIIYPIVLRDRATQTISIQVIAKIPNQPLKRYVVPSMPAVVFDKTIQDLQDLIPGAVNASEQRALRARAQTIYQWLVAPIDQDIQAAASAPTKSVDSSKGAKVDTLVFVLDDVLRNVPLAMLWDGQQYLVEKYSIGLSLGLQLFDPQPLAREPLKVLAAGLSNPPEQFRRQFGELPQVQTEIEAIASLGFSTTSLLEQDFTRQTLEAKINAAPFNVIHLATHGQFSSRAEDTFILAADGPINVTQVDTLLRSRDVVRPEPIQLLVLSACQTAANDNRAILGLAGFAVRAGARSTLATLRNVDDAATAPLIEMFYRELNDPKETITKAEALRRAQLSLLKSQNFRNPKYWAPFVLVGNWL